MRDQRGMDLDELRGGHELGIEKGGELESGYNIWENIIFLTKINKKMYQMTRRSPNWKITRIIFLQEFQGVSEINELQIILWSR